MKRPAWFVVLLLMLFASACVRRHQCRSHLRIKTVFNALQGYTSTYFYNKDGVLVEVSSTNGTRTLIDYTDNMVTGKTSDRAKNLLSTWICFLNNRGLVDSLVKSDSAQVMSTKKYIYDDKGFAIEEHEFKRGEFSTITRKIINNENIISYTVIHVTPLTAKITYDSAMKKNDTVSITTTAKDYTVYSEYYPDKIKTLAFENYGSAEFGEGERNIEKRTVQISPEGDTIDISFFKYAFDKKGRVAMYVTRNQSGDLLDSNYVTYYEERK